jgi:hypothetical protein
MRGAKKAKIERNWQKMPIFGHFDPTFGKKPETIGFLGDFWII